MKSSYFSFESSSCFSLTNYMSYYNVKLHVKLHVINHYTVKMLSISLYIINFSSKVPNQETASTNLEKSQEILQRGVQLIH